MEVYNLIDRRLVHMYAYLPVKLAELSYLNENDALRILRSWEGNTKKLKQLWKETAELLGNDPTIHIPEEKIEVKGEKGAPDGMQTEFSKPRKSFSLFKEDLVKMNAYLPIKLTELSFLNEKATLIILREWGEGKNPLRKLWASVMDELEKAKAKEYDAPI